MSTQIITPGRILFLLGNLAYSLGAFKADYNETHVFNKNWPPHAKFHNGQTMSMSVCLAATSLYFTFRPSFGASTISPRESAFAAAWIGSLYGITGLSAILYPGTHWWDKEYPNNGEQKFIFSGIVAVMWLGYWLEVSRIGKVKGV